MKKSKKIIIGNWKMDPASLPEALKTSRSITRVAQQLNGITTVLCPPHLYLSSLVRYADNKRVYVGVQNIFSENTGAYTGETSVEMVKNAGASYVIVGHSERRALGESDEVVNKKLHLVLQHKLTPVLCIGEHVRDEEGKYLSSIREQLYKALLQVPQEHLTRIIIAYEPVWAIGASVAMNARDVHEMTIYITKSLMEIYKTRTRLKVPVLYGGSVDPTNAYGILSEGEVDGLLVGRQSLDPASFKEILRIAHTV